MLNMPFVLHDPPSGIEREMLKFVNANIAGMIVFQIDLLEANDDYDMECYFPARMFHKDREKCVNTLYELYDTINSSVVYYELLPLQNYLLYQILDGYICDYEDNPDGFGFRVPEKLRDRIIANYIPEVIKEYPDETEEELIESFFYSLENPAHYLELCFDDTDFLDDNLRHYVQLAIYSPGIFRLAMTYEELDQLVDVMPGDVADRYIAYREELDKAIKNDAETAIVNAIFSALSKMQRRIVHFKQLDEVQLTAELDDMIQDNLANEFGVHTKREYNMGRALKKLGETDLYFYKFQDGGIKDLAILENKEIDRFEDQYFQLMGYLNPNFQFGITVSINRRLKLFDARERIFNILNGLEGEFAPKEIQFFDQQDNGLWSKHVVPETGKIMYVYHFIMNLEDESRQAAARKARRSV